jgi:hypothetical protein
MQSSIFPLKEFNNWELITPKTYPALKTFIGAAYTRRMLAIQLRNTVEQMGYTPQNQNMYNIFGNNNNTMATKNKPTKLTSSSSITGGHTAATIQDSVIQVINQLSANQHTLINQMAAMSFNNANNAPPQQYTPPPIQQVNILAHETYSGATTGGFNAVRGGRGRTGRGRGTGKGGGQHQRTPPITCVRRCNREDVAENAEMAILYPRPQVPAQLHHQHHARTSLTSLKASPTGTCATHASSTLKMDTHQSPAPQRGADPTTQKNSRVLTHKNISIKGGICAPKRCTK